MLDALQHAIVAVDAAHAKVSVAWTVEREVEVARGVALHKVGQTVGGKAVGEEGEVAVVGMEPLEYGFGLGVEQEFATLEADGGVACYAAALHDLLYVE